MIEYENCERQWPIGQPDSLHLLREQVTLVRGWTQLVARYSADPRRHEGDILDGLTRIEAATTRLAALLNHVVPSCADVSAISMKNRDVP